MLSDAPFSETGLDAEVVIFIEHAELVAAEELVIAEEAVSVVIEYAEVVVPVIAFEAGIVAEAAAPPALLEIRHDSDGCRYSHPSR